MKQLMETLNRNTTNHSIKIMKEKTIKKACIYCIKNRISPQIYGCLLENYIIKYYDMIKNVSKDAIGDATLDGQSYEIKCSLGGRHFSSYNYVQIRPNHCDNHMLLAYHLNKENANLGGDLFEFRIPESDIKELIILYGNYSHGTQKRLGNITKDKLDDLSLPYEYSLRPKFNSKLWNDLLNFRFKNN